MVVEGQTLVAFRFWHHLALFCREARIYIKRRVFKMRPGYKKGVVNPRFDTPIGVSLPKDIKDKILQEAQERKVSLSSIVREKLDELYRDKQ
jgi:hypothetical protein